MPPSTPPPRRVTRDQAIRNLSLVLLALAGTVLVLSTCFVGIFLFMVAGPGYPLIARDTTNTPAAPDKPIPTPTLRGHAAHPPLLTASEPNTATLATLSEVQRFEERTVGPLATAPDGSMLAVAQGPDILLYNARTLAVVYTLRGHSHNVNALDFAPARGGLLLASSAVDEPALRVWDVPSGQLLWQSSTHAGWFRSLRFSPDGTLLAAASTDGALRLWDVPSASLRATLRGHSTMASDVALSADGTLLASTARDGTLRLWDTARGTPARGAQPRYTVPEDPTAGGAPFWTTGVAFSPDGAQVAVGTTAGSMVLLDSASGRVLHTLRGHRDLVVIRGVAYSPDGALLASASLDGTVRLWDAASGAPRGTLDHAGMPVVGVAWLPDSRHLLTSSSTSGEVLLWDAVAQRVVRRMPLAHGPAVALDYTPDGDALVSAGANGVVRVQRLASGERMLLDGAARTAQPFALRSASSTGTTDTTDTLIVASGTTSSTSTTDGAVLALPLPLVPDAAPQRLFTLPGAAQCVAASPDGTLLAAGSSSGALLVWDAAAGAPRHTLRVTEQADDANTGVALLAFDRAGQRLIAASGAPSPTITVWGVTETDGAMHHRLRGHTAAVASLDVQPGDGLLASASEDGTLRLWDMVQGRDVRRVDLPLAQGYPTRVRFSPDGTLLAHGTARGDLVLWRSDTLEEVARADVGGQGVLALAFRPDGRQIAVGCLDGSVRLLEAAP